MDVIPPPAITVGPSAPLAPDPSVDVASFIPEKSLKSTGADRLRLKGKSLGIFLFEDGALLRDLHHQLLTRLLGAGFKSVIDLEPARRLTATYTTKARDGELQLKGAMTDLLHLAQLSRVDTLIIAEIVDSGTFERKLPVRYRYDASRLADYQTALDTLQLDRDTYLAELDRLKSDYEKVYWPAKEAYDSDVPFFQKMGDQVSDPDEVIAYHTFLDELAKGRRSVPDPTRLPSADALQKAAGERQESKGIAVATAAVRIWVKDARTGSVLTVLEVRQEAIETDRLRDQLVEAIVDGLGGL